MTILNNNPQADPPINLGRVIILVVFAALVIVALAVGIPWLQSQTAANAQIPAPTVQAANAQALADAKAAAAADARAELMQAQAASCVAAGGLYNSEIGCTIETTVLSITTPLTQEVQVVASGVEWAWFTQALTDTRDVASLLAVADRDFKDMKSVASWSQPGFVVPAGSIFWTDLLTNPVPEYVSRIRTQGNWGFYYTAKDYVVPDPNGGGRFVKMDGPLPANLVQKVK